MTDLRSCGKPQGRAGLAAVPIACAVGRGWRAFQADARRTVHRFDTDGTTDIDPDSTRRTVWGNRR